MIKLVQKFQMPELKFHNPDFIAADQLLLRTFLYFL